MLAALLLQSALLTPHANGPIQEFVCDNTDGYHAYIKIDAITEGENKFAEIYFRKSGALLAQLKAQTTYYPASNDTPAHFWVFSDSNSPYTIQGVSEDLKQGSIQVGSAENSATVELPCKLTPMPR